MAVVDLELFREKVQATKYPWETDSFFAFYKAMDELVHLFSLAKTGGMFFVEFLIKDIFYRMRSKTKNEVYEAVRAEQEQTAEREAKTFSTGDDEFDKYRRRCIYHDWYHDYSDDIEVWRRGNEKEKELEKIAKEKGDKYQIYWEYAKRTFRK